MKLAERGGGGPMYQQLRQDLLARMRRGEFAADGLLPSENQLCQQYDVSVTTARRALLELVKEGVVRRQAGVGTMLAPSVRKMRLEFVSIGDAGEPWRRAANTVGAVLSGIGEYAWRHDVALNVTGVFADDAVAHLRELTRERTVDGVLIHSVDNITAEQVDVLETAGLPYVVIKRGIPGRVINCVRGDDHGAAVLLVRHLVEQGHQRIGLVQTKAHLESQRARRAGYVEALGAAGLGLDEGLVRSGTEPTYESVVSLLELPDRPTAVLLGNAAMAAGAYRAAKDLGLSVPADVAFAGFRIDDSQAAGLDPPLTTAHLLAHDLSYAAAKLLIGLVEGREDAPQERVVPATLVVAGSTRDLHAAAGADLGAGETSGDVPAGEASGDLPAVPGRATTPRRRGGGAVMSGHPGALARAVGRALEAQGMSVVWEGEVPELPAGIERVVHHLDGPDTARELRRARERCEHAVSELRGARDGGRILLVARAALDDPIAVATLRAGLAAVVGPLSAAGPAVNALVTGEDATGDALGPIAFLLSDAAAGLSGQVVVCDPRARR